MKLEQRKQRKVELARGYKDFWFSTKRYRVCKGSRGSSKSCTTALWVISMMMALSKHRPNTLYIRKVYDTHRNSTRAQLEWAIRKLGVERLWKIPKGENTLTYLPTGQQILFRGLDQAQKIQSITVSTGYLCWVVFEEAFEIMDESEFNKVDLSIRGEMPAPLFKQITVLLNPWSDKHWIKRRFFDNPDDNTLAITTTYKQNQFLGADDIALFEDMKVRYPKRYLVEGEGNWGISEGVIFENWRMENFNLEELIKKNMNKKDARGLRGFEPVYGLDFGSNDPTAFVAAWVDKKEYKVYVWKELFRQFMTEREIAVWLIENGFQKSVIMADSAQRMTIDGLNKTYGLTGVVGASKPGGSVIDGIRRLQDYEIIVHPSCPNTAAALSNYAWSKEKASGKITDKPEHDWSHIPDALRYATSELPRFGIQV